MKFPVHVLAWPLTLSVALSKEEQIAAESAIKRALLEQDEENYKGAVVLLDLNGKAFLDGEEKPEVKPKIRQKNHLRHHQASNQEDMLVSGAEKGSFSGDTATDVGNLKLYQVEGPLDGLENTSALSSIKDEAEKIYMVIDRQDSTVSTRQKKDSVKMEGDIHFGANGVTENSKSQGNGIPERKDVKIEEKMRRRLRKNHDDSKKRRDLHSNDKDGQLSRQLFLHGNRQEATGNSLHDNKVLLNGCVQGTSSFVTEQCRFFNCCQGEDACEWPADQIATVCPNSCNGYKACYYIAAGTYIGRDSCNGGYASDEGQSCAYIATFSKQGSSRIGRNACNEDLACLRVCYSSTDCQATIGNDACNGGRGSCAWIGEPADDEYFNLQIESVFVGDGSCIQTEPRAAGPCRFVGSFARSVHIGKESCIGGGSCFDLGYYAPLRVRVGDMSCTDYYACVDLGSTAGFNGFKSKVTVGDESCTGEGACAFLGSRNYRNVQVGDNACTNFESCLRFAENIENSNVIVRNGQCRRPKECSGEDNGACLDETTVPNGGSCP